MTADQIKILNAKKDEMLSKCSLLDKNEHSYVSKAYSIIKQLYNNGITIPESLVVDSFEGNENDFVAVYSDINDFSFGVFDGFYCIFDMDNVTDYSWAHSWCYVDFDGLKRMDFQDASVAENYGLLGEKGEFVMSEVYSCDEIDNNVYNLILDDYNYLLKAIEKYSKDRADWFDHLYSWMDQNDIVIESTEIDREYLVNTVNAVVEKILNGDSVHSVLAESISDTLFQK